MKYIRPMTMAAILCATLGLSSPDNAMAGGFLSLAAATTAKTAAPAPQYPDTIQVQKTGVADPPRFDAWQHNNNKYNRPRQRQRYYNPGVFLDSNRHYYDPFYDDPYYDPYYRAPTYNPAPRRQRYSCRQIINMLRQSGYRRIQARDCKGKVYTFFAYAGQKRYKLRIRSRNGSIKTRKRI